MRYVSSMPPLMTSTNTRQVKGLSAAPAVKPVYPREQPIPYAGQHMAPHESASLAVQQQYRSASFEDRRKNCRRVSHQAVLVELRSGIDRRRRNLREGDVVEHIDEKA